MSAEKQPVARPPSPALRIRRRLAGFDWSAIEQELDACGYARLPELLEPEECAEVRGLYAQHERFRSFVELGPRGFGDHGDYRYFAYPLPPLVAALRTHLYARLAPIANRWERRLGGESAFPASLRAFLTRCHEAGQSRPTPLLLRYEPGGYNCLHQDLYGALAFPLQTACLLSEPERDFAGGEFLLTEQRPRQQARGEAIALQRGEGLVFPNASRPVEGARGPLRARVRHGVSRVRGGERFTFGLIFHDAE